MSSWFTSPSAEAIFLLSLTAALGFLIGSIRLKGFQLGSAGILFAGLLLGRFFILPDSHLLLLARELGLMLFVYAIGLQVGPGLFSALRRDGLLLNLLAVAVVFLGVLILLWAYFIFHFQPVLLLGILSGATTNTPSLAAAQQLVKGDLLGLGYALAYPFGILGIIFTLSLLRVLFRINPVREAAQYTKEQRETEPPLVTMNLQITNPNLDGLLVQELPGLSLLSVVISRIWHEGKLEGVLADTKLALGDVILAVGTRENLDQFKLIVGKESEMELRAVSGPVLSRRILISKVEAVGKTLQQLALSTRYGVTITRVARANIEFSPHGEFRLQYGDTLVVVGTQEAIDRAGRALGNSLKQLNEPQLFPLFLGLAVGILVGLFPIYIPGLSVPLRLGLAGGPLLVAILLAHIGRIGSYVWYLPTSANTMLREMGIALFLAVVGLQSGSQLASLFHLEQVGWLLFIGGAVTVLPLLIVGILARLVFRINYAPLCGILTGSMTDPPALAFSHTLTKSDSPSIAYATVYPLTMLLRIFLIQILATLFCYLFSG